MPHYPWDPDRPLDPEALARRVSRATGGPAPRLREFDEGWDNWVLEGPRGMLYRFAKRAAEEKHLRRETRLLRFLEGKLPLPVPRIALAGADFQAYRKLRGRMLVEYDLSPRLVRSVVPAVSGFLTALHGLRPRGLGVRTVPRRPGVLGRRALEALRRLKRAGVSVPPVRRLLDRVPAEYTGPPVLVHNDLLSGHILVARGGVAGIIDWTDAGFGDPAADFAGIAHWAGPRALEEALSRYGRPYDPGLPARACYAALCVGIFDLDYGTANRSRVWVRSGRQALAHLAGRTRPRPNEKRRTRNATGPV